MSGFLLAGQLPNPANTEKFCGCAIENRCLFFATHPGAEMDDEMSGENVTLLTADFEGVRS